MMIATIYGPPETQGSKRIVRSKSGQTLLLDASTKTRDWRNRLSQEMAAVAPETPRTDALTVFVWIYLARPKGHYGTGKNAQQLKPNAPKWPTTKPDADKVLRAVLDAGTGIWWKDDAQVVLPLASKLYADESPPQVIVMCRERLLGDMFNIESGELL